MRELNSAEIEQIGGASLVSEATYAGLAGGATFGALGVGAGALAGPAMPAVSLVAGMIGFGFGFGAGVYSYMVNA